jgi:hypothetical protein
MQCFMQSGKKSQQRLQGKAARLMAEYDHFSSCDLYGRNIVLAVSER